MMDYVKTTADILTWYYHNPNADSNLVTAFRSAMTTSIQSQQQSSAPAEQNNIESLQLNSASPLSSNRVMAQNSDTDSNYDDDDVNNTKNTTTTGDSFNSYSEPLGVSQTSSNANYDVIDGASTVGLTLAAMAAATGAAVSHAFAKDRNSDDE